MRAKGAFGLALEVGLAHVSQHGPWHWWHEDPLGTAHIHHPPGPEPSPSVTLSKQNSTWAIQPLCNASERLPAPPGIARTCALTAKQGGMTMEACRELRARVGTFNVASRDMLRRMQRRTRDVRAPIAGLLSPSILRTHKVVSCMPGNLGNRQRGSQDRCMGFARQGSLENRAPLESRVSTAGPSGTFLRHTPCPPYEASRTIRRRSYGLGHRSPRLQSVVLPANQTASLDDGRADGSGCCCGQAAP